MLETRRGADRIACPILRGDLPDIGIYADLGRRRAGSLLDRVDGYDRI
jgi:hypothetical protein